MSQDFLAEVISDMGREMFPDGSPTDSTYYVQNSTFRTCGEIVVVSLAQGGPPPCFLEQCVYESMSKSIDMISIEENQIWQQKNSNFWTMSVKIAITSLRWFLNMDTLE